MKKIIFILLFSVAAFAKNPLTGTLPVLQGLTDETSSQFSVVYPKDLDLAVEAFDTSTGRAIAAYFARNVSREDNDFAVYQVAFTGLALGHNYELRIFLGNVLYDTRLFHTLDLSRRQYRAAYLSCLNNYLHRSSGWRKFLKGDPDVAFFLGDNEYADYKDAIHHIEADPAFLWKRYVETFQALEVYHMQRLIPILATWDDHDFGQNNGGAGYKYKDESREIFRAFFPQDGTFSKSLTQGPSLAFHWRAFGTDFILTDGRYYKGSWSEGGFESLFGDEQEAWLLGELRASWGPVMLLNGIQWFSPYKKGEGFMHQFPQHFSSLMSKVRDTGARIVFVTGDIHFSEIMKIEADFLGYETREITSSAMHSDSFPGMHLFMKNPRRMDATSSANFVMIDSTVSSSSLSLHIESHGFVPWALMKQDFSLPLR
jgi:alkaline phosphatase D